jgi:hypothetical protein
MRDQATRCHASKLPTVAYCSNPTPTAAPLPTYTLQMSTLNFISVAAWANKFEVVLRSNTLRCIPPHPTPLCCSIPATPYYGALHQATLHQATPHYYRLQAFAPLDFFVGATVRLNKFVFVLLDCDEYAFKYMERCVTASVALCAVPLRLLSPHHNFARKTVCSVHVMHLNHQ